MLLFPILLFIFFSALFFGSVQPNGDAQLVYGYINSTTRNDLKAKIAQGYEIVSVLKAKDGFSGPEFLWTLVKKHNDNDKKNNQQIDALVQKVDEQQKTMDTLVAQIKTFDGKLDTLEKQLRKKGGQ
ncbi:hypothetical protein niasHS_006109 [Heterodera schachtii]|uniref:Uncharacterized protein n=1 Tax=Heterodera schachtii TaxID=97005 RepID=A0ABD2JW30_HETSC